VVSLLELGAGFDDEATARENIFMNAAINGIPRAVALERFSDIIDFAEIPEFVDTPLQYFSSGMYLRLAFSVAIHMNPQILLADEILAVGDQAFQERCLTKVAELGRNGLTVLFVSHDMDAIMRICNRVMWLHQGAIRKLGDPEEVVDEYQNAVWSQADIAQSERGRRSNRYAEVLSVRLVSSTREPPAYLYMLLILVCSTAIFFITAFTVHGIPARLRIPVIAAVTFLLVATLAVIVDLSHPYDGVSTVGPGFMEQVAAGSSRDYQLLWGKPQQACDSSGNPIG